MKVSSVNVTDMIGRHVENPQGAQFRIVSVRYDLRTDRFVAWLAECDERGKDTGEEEAGVAGMKDWTLL